MGRGDKKTAKGKRFKGSFGNSRPRNAVRKHVAPAVKVEEVVEEKVVKKVAKKTTKKVTKTEEKKA